MHPPRHDVVQAIVGAFQAGDPTGLPHEATAEERAAADMLISEMVGQSPVDLGKRATQILFRNYRHGDDWPDLFDRLSPLEVAELRNLYAFMPAQAARHLRERFISPGL